MNLPPTSKIGSILAALAAAGVEVEVIGADGPGTGPFNTKEELIDFLRNNPKDDPTSGPQETAPAAPTNSELAMLKTIASAVADLHGHLCPRIKKTDDNSLARDVELRGMVEALTREVSALESRATLQGDRILALEATVASLAESHRKQVGLLHRRVTKRKVEITTKSNKRRSKRVSDHSAD